jgi:integrase
LATQAVAVLRDLQRITGGGRFVFPGVRTPRVCMSENTVNAALRAMGYGGDVMTGHGFRAMARTILDEVLGERVDLIEHQLAHAVKDPNGRAYNRTAHLPARRAMMQRWADYLDALRDGAEVVNGISGRPA